MIPVSLKSSLNNQQLHDTPLQNTIRPLSNTEGNLLQKSTVHFEEKAGNMYHPTTNNKSDQKPTHCNEVLRSKYNLAQRLADMVKDCQRNIINLRQSIENCQDKNKENLKLYQEKYREALQELRILKCETDDLQKQKNLKQPLEDFSACCKVDNIQCCNADRSTLKDILQGLYIIRSM